MSRFLALAGVCAILSGCAAAPPDPHAIPPVPGASGAGAAVRVDADGTWAVTFAQPSWTFGGRLPSSASGIVTTSGSDGTGAYHDTSFSFHGAEARQGTIRSYDQLGVVLFTQTVPDGAANVHPFPTVSTMPMLPHSLSYKSVQFSPPTMSDLTPDSPFIFFDDQANAFVLSAADHFMNAYFQVATDGTIAAGLDPSIAQLPSGFSNSIVLSVSTSIQQAMRTWGDVLLAKSGKPRKPNDATPVLTTLGYFTDNGASYYYSFDQTKGYAGTMLAVRDYFQQLGVTLGYLQLDSWWYPKGPSADWTAKAFGLYRYEADSTLFPSGLASFQQQLGLPLVTHSRWVDPSSPYRSMYAMSNDVIIDPAYWQSIATMLKAGGVTVYEQDWLDMLALPATDNLTDQDAFLDGMAQAMEQNGLSVQYCMPLPRHHLQSTKYPSLDSIRVTYDHFMPARWHDALYVSELASSLGVWPWVDVFASTEPDNLLLAVLSAGMVGVGDAIGAASKDNLLQAVRPDGVIVKPDTPLVPLDQSWVDEANQTGKPLVAAAFTELGGNNRAAYVFAFGADASANVSFTPSALGFSGQVAIWNVFSGASTVEDASQAYMDVLSNGRAYFEVVPVGPSGDALFGDVGKRVSLGKKRVAALVDDGKISVDLVFAAGEGPVMLAGWSPKAPAVTATVGSVSSPSWNVADGQFRVQVTPQNGAAHVELH